MPKINIIAVDDEELMVMFIKEFLECYGYSVDAYTDASLAYKEIESNIENIDLLITDQTMPTMTGLDLISKVRNIKKTVPVILYSGYTELDIENILGDDSTSFYLHKPVENAHLIKCVKQLLS